MVEEMARALELTDISHRIGRKECGANALQVERHAFDQSVVIPACLLQMIFERLAEPLESLFKDVVDSVDLESCGRPATVGRFVEPCGQSLSRMTRASCSQLSSRICSAMRSIAPPRVR